MCQVVDTVIVMDDSPTPPPVEKSHLPMEGDGELPTLAPSMSDESAESNASPSFSNTSSLEEIALDPMEIVGGHTPQKNIPEKIESEYSPLSADDIPECWTDQQDEGEEDSSSSESPNETNEHTPRTVPSAAEGQFKRMARKAGVILGGGTLTAVGTFLLFVPAPTPSIYMMIGGMAVLAKEFPAAQRQLDNSRESLKQALERAEKVDKEMEEHDLKASNSQDGMEGSTLVLVEEASESEIASQPTDPTIKPKKSAVKKHFEKVGRSVILPLLNKVCTPDQDGEDEENKELVTEDDDGNSPRRVTDCGDKESERPSMISPFAKFVLFRENLRQEFYKAEERREREAMLTRCNEAALKKVQNERVVGAEISTEDDSVSTAAVQMEANIKNQMDSSMSTFVNSLDSRF
jgi:hypothetical protein